MNKRISGLALIVVGIMFLSLALGADAIFPMTLVNDSFDNLVNWNTWSGKVTIGGGWETPGVATIAANGQLSIGWAMAPDITERAGVMSKVAYDFSNGGEVSVDVTAINGAKYCGLYLSDRTEPLRNRGYRVTLSDANNLVTVVDSDPLTNDGTVIAEYPTFADTGKLSITYVASTNTVSFRFGTVLILQETWRATIPKSGLYAEVASAISPGFTGAITADNFYLNTDDVIGDDTGLLRVRCYLDEVGTAPYSLEIQGPDYPAWTSVTTDSSGVWDETVSVGTYYARGTITIGGAQESGSTLVTISGGTISLYWGEGGDEDIIQAIIDFLKSLIGKVTFSMIGVGFMGLGLVFFVQGVKTKKGPYDSY